MRTRDIVFILLGILLCAAGFFVYQLLGPTILPRHAKADFNDEISRQRANAIVLASAKISPAVVSITVVQTRFVSASPFFSSFNNDFFSDFFPELYYKQKVKSLGTGFIISEDGYILTNEHVISNATDINITLTDSRQFKGKIVAATQALDLALIKIEAGDLLYAELGNSDSLMIGEWMIAMGNPFGFLLEDTRPTVTVGVISALNRAIKSTRASRTYKDLIQTDAAINPGNSGGPLVNIMGQVVGINTFILTSSGGSEGIGFARPINDVKKFIEEAKKLGR